jgi:Arc/MetJ-type ribon-helix-helix transcriptional regulator
MPKIVAQVPDDIYRNINEDIRLGVFSDASEAVVLALKKAYEIGDVPQNMIPEK